MARLLFDSRRAGLSLLAWLGLAMAAVPVRAASPAAGSVNPLRVNAQSETLQRVYNAAYLDDVGNEDAREQQDEIYAEFEKRLKALEGNYADLSDAHSDLEKSLDGNALAGHSGATMKVNGRIHTDVWAFPGDSPGVNGFESGDVAISPQDRIGFRRIRFGVRGTIPCNMLYKIEMEFAGGDESEFRDVYIGWEELPILQTLLIGNQKRPYGLDHLNSSRYNVFIERPWVIESFNQDARRIGIQSYGVSDDLAWNWRYGAFNQRLIQDEGSYISDHWQGQIAGRMANTIWWDKCSDGRSYAHWAVSGTWADTDGNADADNFAESSANEAQFRHRPEARTVSRWLDTGRISGAEDYGLLGAEAVVNVGPVQLVGEYQNVWVNRPSSTNLHFHGGYFYLSYFLTGEHMPWDRETGMLARIVPRENFVVVDRCGRRACGLGAWQVAVRYSIADFADRDIQGGIADSVTAGLNWYWTPYAGMQFNYLYGNITNNDLNAAPGGPNFGDYHILGMRFRVDF